MITQVFANYRNFANQCLQEQEITVPNTRKYGLILTKKMTYKLLYFWENGKNQYYFRFLAINLLALAVQISQIKVGSNKCCFWKYIQSLSSISVQFYAAKLAFLTKYCSLESSGFKLASTNSNLQYYFAFSQITLSNIL